MYSKATFIPVRKNDLPHNELEGWQPAYRGFIMTSLGFRVAGSFIFHVAQIWGPAETLKNWTQKAAIGAGK